MKWTSDKDQILLLLILQTNPMAFNYQAIAQIWPGNDKPTARAISEHIIKLRSDVKKSGISIGNGTPRTVPATPRKAVKNEASTPKSNRTVTPAKKRKLKQEAGSDSSGDEIHVSRREMSELTASPSISRYHSVFDAEDNDVEEPTPRQRRAASSMISGYVKQEVADDSDDGGRKTASLAESDISDYESDVGARAVYKSVGMD